MNLLWKIKGQHEKFQYIAEPFFRQIKCTNNTDSAIEHISMYKPKLSNKIYANIEFANDYVYDFSKDDKIMNDLYLFSSHRH